MLGHRKRQLLARGQADGDSSALAESRLHHVILPTVLCVSMFAWTFVQVGLPFYVQEIAGETHAATLRWIGWILGITPILTILTTPMWMRISRHSPVRFYVLIQLLQGSAFVVMALARGLPELFAVRVFLGITGPPTAVAFLIAARSRMSPTTRATSAMQSAMTLGIIAGPLAAGTLTARVGYTGSFLIGGMLLVGCAALVGRNGPDARGHDAMARSKSARPSIVDIAALCLISLVTYTQMFFLGSILPAILPSLGAKAGSELQTAAWILFGSGVLLVVGAWATPWISHRIGEIRTMGACIIASSLCLGLLGIAPGISSFFGLRLAQALMLAPVFPLVLTRVLRWHDDQAVGVANSARFAANFVGPVVATTLLSWAQVEFVFAVFAVAGLACIPLLIVTRNSGVPERP